MNRIISVAILVFAFITLVLTLSKGFVRKKYRKDLLKKIQVIRKKQNRSGKIILKKEENRKQTGAALKQDFLYFL